MIPTALLESGRRRRGHHRRRGARVLITLYPDKLTENGVAIGQSVTGVLAADDLTFPSGSQDGGVEDPLFAVGRIKSVDAVKNLVVGVKAPAGGPPGLPRPAPPCARRAHRLGHALHQRVQVTIGDLGTVKVVGVATSGYARTNGQPSVSISVSKTSDADTVQVADDVTAKLKELGGQHTDAVTITVISDPVLVHRGKCRDGLLREGGLGHVAVLSIFLFLASIRATIVAAVSIPLSILAALVVMQLTGVTLNIMTLGGLAVAVGRVVDDAIVVLESIYRHGALGEDR